MTSKDQGQNPDRSERGGSLPHPLDDPREANPKACGLPDCIKPGQKIEIVSLLELDSNRLLALNNRHAVELSWLEKKTFDDMISGAFYARGIAPAQAFLIAFDQTADYDGFNFLWFRACYRNFVYVDRVVVDLAFRGRGAARALYQDLFDQAKSRRRNLIVCEVNVDPPNPASDGFHKHLGFDVVGQNLTPSGKRVQYLAKNV